MKEDLTYHSNIKVEKEEASKEKFLKVLAEKELTTSQIWVLKAISEGGLKDARLLIEGTVHPDKPLAGMAWHPIGSTHKQIRWFGNFFEKEIYRLLELMKDFKCVEGDGCEN